MVHFSGVWEWSKSLLPLHWYLFHGFVLLSLINNIGVTIKFSRSGVERHRTPFFREQLGCHFVGILRIPLFIWIEKSNVASEMARYSLYSALLLTRRSKVVHCVVGNRVTSGTHVLLSVTIWRSSVMLLSNMLCKAYRNISWISFLLNPLYTTAIKQLSSY